MTILVLRAVTLYTEEAKTADWSKYSIRIFHLHITSNSSFEGQLHENIVVSVFNQSVIWCHNPDISSTSIDLEIHNQLYFQVLFNLH